MRVVVDTNLMLTCISRRSHINWLFQSMLKGDFQLCVTTEILNEYAEIIARHMGQELADYVLKTIMNLASLHRVEVYYKWNLITQDPDDNKFSDCAIAAKPDFLLLSYQGISAT